jgi:hypothetical protein
MRHSGWLVGNPETSLNTSSNEIAQVVSVSKCQNQVETRTI